MGESRLDGLKGMFLNRWYVYFALGTIAVLFIGSATVRLLSLSPHTALLLGFGLSVPLTGLRDWLIDWKEAREVMD